MLIVLFILFVLLIVMGFWLVGERYEGTGVLSIFIGVIGILFFVCCVIGCCVGLSKSTVVDKKINMYTEENTKIEEQIDSIVKEYMEYEGKTFSELKGENSMALVSLYPELKSDELVKSQIETYRANNEKIKGLKEIKINAQIYKWWLYFGK